MDRRVIRNGHLWGVGMSELVQLTDIAKVYQGGVTGALNGVSLILEEGEFTAVMGPSGSGKSTLLNMVAGLDRPTSGSVVVAGTDLGRLGEAGLARFRRDRIGFVFQFFHLLPNLTVLENVLIPAQLRSRVSAEAPGRKLMDRLGIEDIADRYPARLSGGQQQRVAIARALINRPTLLLADEPTGALDTRSGDQVMDLLMELHRHGQTILLVTHDAKLATRYAARVISVMDGRIVDDARLETAEREAADVIRVRGEETWRRRPRAPRRCRIPRTCLDQEPRIPGLAYIRQRQPELTLELDVLAAGHSQQGDLDVVPSRERLKLGHCAGCRAHDEAAGGLAEERAIEAERRLRTQRRTAHAQATQKTALGEGDQHASLGAVMGGAEQAGLGRGQDQPVDRTLAREIERGRATGHGSVFDLQVLAASEIVVARPHQQHKVALVFQSRREPAAVILDQPDHAHHRRGMDWRGTARVVVQAHVPAHDRHLQRAARMRQAVDRLFELPVDLRPVGVGEIEAVGDS